MYGAKCLGSYFRACEFVDLELKCSELVYVHINAFNEQIICLNVVPRISFNGVHWHTQKRNNEHLKCLPYSCNQLGSKFIEIHKNAYNEQILCKLMHKSNN